MAHSDFGDSTNLIHTWSAGVLPISEMDLGHLLGDLLLLLGRAAFVPLDGYDGHGYAARAGSSSCRSRFLGSAPTIWCATWPFLKSRIVGIDITW